MFRAMPIVPIIRTVAVMAAKYVSVLIPEPYFEAIITSLKKPINLLKRVNTAIIVADFAIVFLFVILSYLFFLKYSIL